MKWATLFNEGDIWQYLSYTDNLMALKPNSPVNFPCWRKPEYPEKTHDFRQSVDYTLFTWGLGSSPH